MASVVYTVLGIVAYIALLMWSLPSAVDLCTHDCVLDQLRAAMQ